ncbi:4'-phosphopantetheinyl transferase superfamily protein [uncultured Tenacibaculum sp.]|uniref:4'-phosphopantetheinyl transferase family protein n=1 Tax=uncultured Tenacibaculum sp. TaxID=174713 RepID=UPI002635042B|nr:4'-phosphopantetheinyl transferase superfamily protein [uncultured Tenacibaculum sp.]
MTSIYYTSCKKLPENEYRKLSRLLPKKMQERLYKFRRWQDAYTYLYGKLLLKKSMLQFGYDNSLESIKTTEHGKPYFENTSFSFNISHSEEYVVCAISNDEKVNLGIDIEKVKPIKLDGFSAVFSPEEKREIDSYNKFYTCWTRKEAIVKADGRGLTIPLNTINTLSSSTKLDDEKYYLSKVDINKGYIAHIASQTKIEKMNVINFCF